MQPRCGAVLEDRGTYMFKLPEFDPDWDKACLDCKYLNIKQSNLTMVKICMASPIGKRGRTGAKKHEYAIWAIIDGPCGPSRSLKEPRDAP